MKSIAIIDTSYQVHRSVYKGINLYTTSGVPSGGTYLFLKSLWNIKDIGNPILVMDKGRAQFRKDVYPEYKKRAPKEDTAEQRELDNAFSVTFSIIEKLLPKMGIPVVSIDKQEADDIAYSLAKQLLPKVSDTGGKVYLVSDDNDWLQCLNLGCHQYKALKNEMWDVNHFKEQMGFGPEYFALYKALIGDSSDNITNIKGLGPVTAKQIISELNEPTVISLYGWAAIQKTKVQKKLFENFHIVKRNTLLMDFNHMQLEDEEVMKAYVDALTRAKIDMNYVQTKFRLLEFHSLSSWLVHLKQFCGG